MTNSSEDNSNFFNILTSLNSLQHNPFSGEQILVNGFHYDLISALILYNGNNSYDIKCPICLCLIRSPTRPSNCRHIFCNYCIKHWFQQSKKCPICRKEFSFLIEELFSSLLYNQRRII